MTITEPTTATSRAEHLPSLVSSDLRSVLPPLPDKAASGFADFRVLCELLGAQDTASLRGERLDQLEWRPMVALAARYDVLPALAVRCQQLDVNPVALGGTCTQLLSDALMENTRRNMQITAQSIKIAHCLNRNGIVPVFLKGSARLLTSDSDHIGFRKQVDIDLLVPPGQVKDAAETLLADGYRFWDASGSPAYADVADAIRASAAHHHLPPLARDGYAATVELHTHYLPVRFQRRNPLAPLLESAREIVSQGVRFRVVSPEHHIVHLVLGNFVHDGYRSRCEFPVRESCDLLQIVNGSAGRIDHRALVERCGVSYPLFLGLACELMGLRPGPEAPVSSKTGDYLRLLEKRFRSPRIARLLDMYARANYLVQALAYSPAKLSAYLGRRSFVKRIRREERPPGR